MKFLPSIVIACVGMTWALPSHMERQLYIPCSSSDIFNTPFCCTRGLLGNVSSCALPLLPFSDQNFEDQCTLFQKTAVCCIRPLLLGTPPTLCIPVTASLTASEDE
ncbi:hypothetical protein GGS24DRAFT_453908 [Hypoxylon argillaceum]|nr:hypothetical protein GGS24DRAFT_453908 [Hypoxylon argillaceum]KAI1153314.1 hypothetical protein F4825DRAFT_415624 [Nemania diffusa]